MKNSVDCLSSRKKYTEDRICKLEDTTIKIVQSKQKRRNRLKKNKTPGAWRNIIKNLKLESRRRVEIGWSWKVLEVMAENVSNLEKKNTLRIQQAK